MRHHDTIDSIDASKTLDKILYCNLCPRIPAISVSVAASFVVGSLVNMKAEVIANVIKKRWPDTDPAQLDPGEQPVLVLVPGIGRVGHACYQRRMKSGYVVPVLSMTLSPLSDLKREVLHGDAVDGGLWHRLRSVSSLRKVILTIPFHSANLAL